MKPSNWDYSLTKREWHWHPVALLIAAWALLLLSVWCGPAQAEFIVVREATISTDRQGSADGQSSGDRKALPFKWDTYFPGQNGRITYELVLPPRTAYLTSTSQDLFALYAPRVGNQVQVRFNGHVIAVQGGLDDTLRDSSEMPLYVPIPASLVHEREPNLLVFQTSAQALRLGGLSEVYFGLDRELSPINDRARLWQKTSYVVIVVSLMLMGLLSFLIWLRQRIYESAKLYLYFVWSALAGCIAALDHLLMQHYLPWPVQGIVAAVALAWHVIFMSRFALEVAGRQEKWVSLSMLASTLAIGIAYVLAEPVYWTVTLGLLCLPLAAALIGTAQAADAERSGQARLLFAVSLIAALVALRDFFFVQWPQSGMSQFVLLPHALFLFVLVMGGILVKRYTEQHRLFHDLNIHLEARVTEKELQLMHSFAALQQQGEERAKLLERQRIMQDIHDGVGGQLVGLVNMAKRAQVSGDAFDHKQLQEHAQLALDELRIAVDAMQPVDGDLTTVLATLRYRLEPRLKASDIRLVWQIEDLPLMQDLTPRRVLQIQKILLEAFSNIMRHAQANTVTVSATVDSSSADPAAAIILLRIADDGIGFDAQKTLFQGRESIQGHGLGNMHFRADAIGATLSIESGVTRGLPQGTTLTLHIPV